MLRDRICSSNSPDFHELCKEWFLAHLIHHQDQAHLLLRFTKLS
jgi:hypothetical protein